MCCTMLVAVAGGTGLIGRAVVKALKSQGHEVVIISRRSHIPEQRCMSWNQLSQEGLPKGTDAVIQLAGQSILKIPRWTEEHKKEVLNSRIDTAGMLVAAMQRAPPRVFVMASAVGYYPSNNTEAHTEEASPGADFPAEVCKQVEAIADQAATHVARVVKMRIGVVLSKRGGALQQMWMPFWMGLGGRLGTGEQPFPWIHIVDLVGLYLHALHHEGVAGPLNAVAPASTDNYAFTKALGQVLGRPTIVPVPGFALRLAMGEQSGLLLDGPKVAPAKAIATGYQFQWPELIPALVDIRDSGEY
uniref:DUF1731 domain-containing protein n=1 Tax=Eutreptiella gymnastica TaxID=73025 RepID=A0A7S1JHS0_9EUGL